MNLHVCKQRSEVDFEGRKKGGRRGNEEGKLVTEGRAKWSEREQTWQVSA